MPWTPPASAITWQDFPNLSTAVSAAHLNQTEGYSVTVGQSVVDYIPFVILPPTGGDDAAALAALLPAVGGTGLTIKLQAGKVYNWGSTVRLPYGLTSWLTIDPEGAVIDFASGVTRAFDLYDGTTTSRTYQFIRIKPGGFWVWNAGSTLPAGNSHVLLGNLIAGSPVGHANFNHVHCKGQVVLAVPVQATPSLQHVSLWVTDPGGSGDDVEIDGNRFYGGCIAWAVLANSSNPTATLGVVKTRNNRFDTGVTPTNVSGAFGTQVGGYALTERYEAMGNRVANSWDEAIEADNCLSAVIESNETIDCYNDHVLFRNLGGIPNPEAQHLEVRKHLFRNVNYDPSGVNGSSNHLLLGASASISNGTGTTANGSRSVTGATGTWSRGQNIQGTGIPLGTVVEAVSGSAGSLTLTLSLSATASATVSLSYQDWQLGTVLMEDSTSSFESPLTDTGVHTGIVAQARYANIRKLKVSKHTIGVGPNFAYTPTAGSHLNLIDASPFSSYSELELTDIRANFAGVPANAANFIEIIRLNPVRAVVAVSDIALDITSLTATSISSLSWLIVAAGYQLGAPYPNASAKVNGVIERLRAYNTIYSTALDGFFAGSSVVVSGAFLRIRGCDFLQWGSTSGSDYTANVGDAGRLIVESPAGARAGGSTPLLQSRTVITPGASPYAYQNLDLIVEDVIVSGGTVSAIDYSDDNATYDSTGVIAGKLRVEPGSYLRVTYTVAPTMVKRPAK